MLEKPDLAYESIITCLENEYGLNIAVLDFLPLGADQNTAVYRAVAHDSAPYFVKLRSGLFDETSVDLPKFLSDQGIRQIITPLAAKNGRLWGSLNEFKTILYPFIDGRDGYQLELSDRQWGEFGAALKRIHTLNLPQALANRISRETCPPQGREMVKTFLARTEPDLYSDGVAVQLAAFLKARQNEILDLVGHAERYAQTLQTQPPELVLCHSDLHAGNILVENGGAFYIVDWDNPILAPKERDLMFIGGAQGFHGHTAKEEERLFYQGYGPARVDRLALAYYRYERIIQDIAVYCQQLLSSDAGGDDREQSLVYLKSNFLPGNTIEAANQADRLLRL